MLKHPPWEKKGSYNASTGFFEDVHDSLLKAVVPCLSDAVLASLPPVKGLPAADSKYIRKRANCGISTVTFLRHSLAAAEKGSDSPGHPTSLRSPTGLEPSRREVYRMERLWSPRSVDDLSGRFLIPRFNVTISSVSGRYACYSMFKHRSDCYNFCGECFLSRGTS
jgi:hypothetical protein